MADVCEVLAVARIDPATYGVLSQGRLLSSAAAGWIICGAWQTGLQWGHSPKLTEGDAIGCHLRRVPRQSLMEPYDLLDHLLGGAFALAKVTLSVLCSVYVETCFKSSRAHPMRLHVQMTQVSFSSIIAATTGYLLICILHHEDPSQFFSGQDGSWTQRTLIHFDSLVKNICNAVSLVVTYMFTVAARETDFSILKAMLLVAIVLEVINYCFTRRNPAPVPVELPTLQPRASAGCRLEDFTMSALKSTKVGIVVEFVLFDVLRVISDASGAAVNPKDAADFDALAKQQDFLSRENDEEPRLTEPAPKAGLVISLPSGSGIPAPPEREAQVMDRLNTVVGKLQEAASTLDGGPNAGAFLEVASSPAWQGRAFL
eukprot:g6427.t1